MKHNTADPVLQMERIETWRDEMNFSKFPIGFQTSAIGQELTK
jgi:hypothetical protein